MASPVRTIAITRIKIIIIVLSVYITQSFYTSAFNIALLFVPPLPVIQRSQTLGKNNPCLGLILIHYSSLLCIRGWLIYNFNFTRLSIFLAECRAKQFIHFYNVYSHHLFIQHRLWFMKTLELFTPLLVRFTDPLFCANAPYKRWPDDCQSSSFSLQT